MHQPHPTPSSQPAIGLNANSPVPKVLACGVAAGVGVKDTGPEGVESLPSVPPFESSAMRAFFAEPNRLAVGIDKLLPGKDLGRNFFSDTK